MTAQRVLVTGGAGFIGANLAPVLAGEGFATRCFDNFTTGHRADAERAGYDEIQVGDLLDDHAVAEAVRGCQYVVHLAAQTGVPGSIADPVRDADVNVRGTLNALLAARDAGARAFVLASSNAPLGDVTPPAHEQIVPRPKSPYGASKLAAEGYCSAFAHAYGLPTVALRFSNVYGPLSYHKGSVVAKYCKQALAGEPLIIFGDGSQTRDFVFVGDICRGIAAALTSGAGGVIAHLGTGIETPVADVAKAVIELVGDPAVHVEYQAERVGDIVRNCADISRARQLFGYAPATALDAGLAETVSWFRQGVSA